MFICPCSNTFWFVHLLAFKHAERMVMKTPQASESSQVWKVPPLFVEGLVLMVVTLWLALLALEHLIEAYGVWKMCTASGEASCVPWLTILFGILAAALVSIASYKKPTMMCFVGTIFFGLFVAGFCGIIGLFVSPFPAWMHIAAFAIGIVGATALNTESLEELLHVE